VGESWGRSTKQANKFPFLALQAIPRELSVFLRDIGQVVGLFSACLLLATFSVFISLGELGSLWLESETKPGITFNVPIEPVPAHSSRRFVAIIAESGARRHPFRKVASSYFMVLGDKRFNLVL